MRCKATVTPEIKLKEEHLELMGHTQVKLFFNYQLKGEYLNRSVDIRYLIAAFSVNPFTVAIEITKQNCLN